MHLVLFIMNPGHFSFYALGSLISMKHAGGVKPPPRYASFDQTAAKNYGIMEGYRRGHNEAVLKTVWADARVGSNPTPSAIMGA